LKSALALKILSKIKKIPSWKESVATTPEEVRNLGKAEWVKYDEITVNGTSIHVYRKPKRFVGLQ
jgi:uncharacterized protein involved in tolerance to divalent cations